MTTAEAKADVKRCNGIREALTLLDFDDASIGDIKRYLLRAAFSPAFLRVPEGRRFIAFLFTLQPQMVRFLLSVALFGGWTSLEGMSVRQRLWQQVHCLQWLQNQGQLLWYIIVVCVSVQLFACDCDLLIYVSYVICRRGS